jgi:hypothetical protein
MAQPSEAIMFYEAIKEAKSPWSPIARQEPDCMRLADIHGTATTWTVSWTNGETFACSVVLKLPLHPEMMLSARRGATGRQIHPAGRGP